MASNECNWNTLIVDNESHDLRFSVTFKNFLDHVCEPGEELETRQMECAQSCGAKWILSFCPQGQSTEEKDYIPVYLVLAAKPPQAELVTATYKIYLVGRGGQKLKSSILCNVKEPTLKTGYGPNCLIKRSEMERNRDLYLPEGHLTIRCEGKEFLNKPHQTLAIEKLPQVVEFDKSSHTSGFVKTMYEEGICSDVTLKAGSGEFKCHKAVLAATSAYFKAMFQHDMKENSENVVDLSKDLNEVELKALLDYIYLGKRDFDNFTLSSIQILYNASDMYEIGGLTEVCEMELIKHLNKGNARDQIAFAMLYCAKSLEKAAATIIAKGVD